MKGAIFDMDGTLLDSMTAWTGVGERIVRAHGVTPPEDLYQELKALGTAEGAAYLKERFGLRDSIGELVDQIHRDLEGQYQFTVPAKPGALAYLQRLKSQGVRICVATATARILSEAALRRTGLWEHLDFMLTCHEVGAGKDRPDIFEQACEKLGVAKQECVVFEDALHAMETAKSAGFFVVALADESAKPDEQAIRALADLYVTGFGQLEGVAL